MTDRSGLQGIHLDARQVLGCAADESARDQAQAARAFAAKQLRKLVVEERKRTHNLIAIDTARSAPPPKPDKPKPKIVQVLLPPKRKRMTHDERLIIANEHIARPRDWVARRVVAVVGQESGTTEPVHVAATGERDLTVELKRGLADARRNSKRHRTR